MKSLEKKSKKVAIMTLYYCNKNYGGLLQAYALTKTVNKMGYICEQLCWQYVDSLKPPIKRSFITKIRKRILKEIIIFLNKIYSSRISLRNNQYEQFQQSIPHSEIKYTRENIEKANEEYDGFIAGSDQVWNMSWYNPEYFLNFVSKDKYKFSYAASMPDVNISEADKNKVINHLADFNDISVRESNTAEFLTEILNRKVLNVLDPTLLLSEEEWSQVASERPIKQKYIFCYFLGKNPKDRKLVKNFARKTGLKIASFPHLDRVDMVDIGFAKYNFYVGPKEFLSLIKNAEYVFTDSFHAAVFSNIFKVKHFVFSRQGQNMDSRVKTLLSMFEQQYRFCDTNDKYNVNYILSQKDKTVSGESKAFNDAKKESMDFLYKNLKEISKNEK